MRVHSRLAKACVLFLPWPISLRWMNFWPSLWSVSSNLIHNWCASQWLQLNASNTELVWFGMRASLQKTLSLDRSLCVDADIVNPTTVDRDLGIHLDNQPVDDEEAHQYLTLTRTIGHASFIYANFTRSDAQLVVKSVRHSATGICGHTRLAWLL